MSSRSLNKVMLIGNLTRDPELRYTPSGTAVSSFGVATNRSWMPSDSSERREETEFHRIVAWNKLAELCAQLLTKGRKVYIEGRLQTRSWETPNGERRQTTEVVAEDMVILDQRRPVEVSEEKGTKEEKEETPDKDQQAEETKAEGKEEKTKEKEEKKKEKETTTVGEKKGKEKEKEKEEKADDEIDIDDIPF